MTQTSTPAPMLTSVTEVRKALAAIEINAQVGQFDRAAHLEREMTAGVLEAIASGNAQAGYLAAAALESRDIDFPRTTA